MSISNNLTSSDRHCLTQAYQRYQKPLRTIASIVEFLRQPRLKLPPITQREVEGFLEDIGFVEGSRSFQLNDLCSLYLRITRQCASDDEILDLFTALNYGTTFDLSPVIVASREMLASLEPFSDFKENISDEDLSENSPEKINHIDNVQALVDCIKREVEATTGTDEHITPGTPRNSDIFGVLPKMQEKPRRIVRVGAVNSDHQNALRKGVLCRSLGSRIRSVRSSVSARSTTDGSEHDGADDPLLHTLTLEGDTDEDPLDEENEDSLSDLPTKLIRQQIEDVYDLHYQRSVASPEVFMPPDHISIYDAAGTNLEIKKPRKVTTGQAPSMVYRAYLQQQADLAALHSFKHKSKSVMQGGPARTILRSHQTCSPSQGPLMRPAFRRFAREKVLQHAEESLVRNIYDERARRSDWAQRCVDGVMRRNQMREGSQFSREPVNRASKSTEFLLEILSDYHRPLSLRCSIRALPELHEAVASLLVPLPPGLRLSNMLFADGDGSFVPLNDLKLIKKTYPRMGGYVRAVLCKDDAVPSRSFQHQPKCAERLTSWDEMVL